MCLDKFSELYRSVMSRQVSSVGRTHPFWFSIFQRRKHLILYKQKRQIFRLHSLNKDNCKDGIPSLYYNSVALSLKTLLFNMEFYIQIKDYVISILKIHS